MKSCPQCLRSYPDDAGFCPADGTNLIFASLVPVPATADGDARIGKRLCDRYELRRVVADGGMGRVYEGIDKQTNTRIAVKVLHDEISRDDVALERFKREFRFSAELPHPHIVKVLDFQRDETAGVWLLVMEFLDGEELRHALKREKCLPPERLVRMLSQVALGLDEAHSKHLVHRDLKPDNLFLCGTREGDDTKILDFGSVKDTNKDAKKLTVLGTTIGSPFYMAPEQAQGLETLDARADVFALAAITYEAVVGQVPFMGSNGPSILLAILTKDPEPASIKGKDAKYPIPAALDDVFDLGLAKNPNHRIKNVGELADQVGRAYGLVGDHKIWAKAPQADLALQVAEGRTRGVAKAVEAVADPFASDPFGPSAAQPGPQVGNASGGQAAVVGPAPVVGGREAANQMDAAFSASREIDFGGETGVPASKPGWLIPVVALVALLVVGGGIAAIFALR